MRIVLDTNVLISATLWDNSVSQKLLYKLILNEVEIYSSLEILREYRKVLKRDFEYLEEEVDRKIEILLIFLKIVNPHSKVDIVKEDPEDNKIINCALDSSASHILTYDNHLLKINLAASTRRLE